MTIEEIERSLANGFHDARLKGMDIDYAKREVRLDLQADIGIPETREGIKDSYRACRLTLSGLLFCVIEPPGPGYQHQKAERLWIADSGPATSAEFLSKLPYPLPEGAFAHYFFYKRMECVHLSGGDGRSF